MKPNAKPSQGAQPPVIATEGSRLKRTKSTTMSIISVAAIIVVFCLVASKALLNEAAHQRRVLSKKHAAVNQLKDDITAINSLSSQYQAFNGESTNIIGGNSSGTGPNDGNNDQIVLDALPSQYDFPGLTASVEKLLSQRSVKLDNISGVDNEAANIPQAVPDPKPVVMTFSFAATSSYSGVKNLYKDFSRSIRPFHVVTMQLSGTDSSLSLNSTINTYYQPAKSLSITSKGVQ